METYLELPETTSSIMGRQYQAVYQTLEGETEEATKTWLMLSTLKQNRSYDDIYYKTHIVTLALVLDQPLLIDAYLEQLQQRLSVINQEEPAPLDQMVELYCEAVAAEKIDETMLKRCDELMKTLRPVEQCNYRYFLGCALAHEGQREPAEKYWREVLTLGEPVFHSYTLAGAMLYELNGEAW